MMKRLLPFFATILARTLRIRWNAGPLPERAVIVFWHGKMFAGWWAVRKTMPVGLVSASEDGSLLAAVLEQWRYLVVRGSSSRAGWEAMDKASAMIKRGDANTIVVTPDGPRGPREVFKRGAFVVAKELGLPLIFLSIEYSNARCLDKSWDLFEVPRPFSRVTITPMEINLTDFPEQMEAQHAWLASRSGAFSSPEEPEGAGAGAPMPA